MLSIFFSIISMLQYGTGLRLAKNIDSHYGQEGNTSVIRVDGNVYSLDAEWTHSDTPSFEPNFCKKQKRGMKMIANRRDKEFISNDLALMYDLSNPTYGMFEVHGCCTSGKYNLAYPTARWSMKKLMEKWANKTIGFFGDSLTQQHIDAIALGLEELGVRWVKTDRNTFQIPDYKITIERHCEGKPACGVISPLPGGKLSAKSTYPTTTKLFVSALQTADIYYINVGVHLSPAEPDNLKLGEFEYIKDTLESLLKEKPQNQYFVRLTYPQHFIGNNGTGSSYENRASMGCVAYGTPTEEHHTSKLARDIFKGSPVKVLDYHNLLSTRGDLHLKDCTHFCYNHQMYKAQFALMEAALN